MRLFLIRHAHAVSADENPQRPLSPRGRKQVRELATFLRQSGALACAEFWHSPLARSVETARRLVDHLHLDAKLVEIPALDGEADPQLVAARLRSRRTPLALVGHEPHLSALASLLIAGKDRPPCVVLDKSSVLALERSRAGWSVLWQLAPDLLEPRR